MSLIRLQRVVKRYAGGHEALRGIDLEIAAGEFVAIVGPSGAGKSTLVKLLPALERPSAGAVWVGAENVGEMKRAMLPFLRRRMGVVVQGERLLADRSVLDNVRLPLTVVGVAAREANERARAALERVGLAGRDGHAPLSLSGGEQQRVAIARAIVARPSLVIADEPTSNLDEAQAAAIGRLLRSFQEAGTTVVVATHDGALARRFATRVVALAEGRLAA